MRSLAFTSRLLRLALLLGLLPLLTTSAGCDSRATEVKETMTRLIHATEARDAETVASLYTRSTYEHYDDVLRLAREATREQIGRLSMHERLEVLHMRHSMTLAEMKSLDGCAYIKKCVRDGSWQVEWGVEDYGKVKVTGNSAWMEVKEPDRRITRAGRRWLEDKRQAFNIRFYFEGEEWKLDETSLLDLWDRLLLTESRSSGMMQDEFLFALLEESSGKPVSKSIWDPPRK